MLRDLRIIILLMECFSISTEIQAQHSKIPSGTEFPTIRKIILDKNYVILSSNIGMLNWTQPAGDFGISFPYTSTLVSSNTTTNNTFKGTLHRPFRLNPIQIDVFNLDFVSRQHSIGFQLGLSSNYFPSKNDDNMYCKGGYNYVLPLNLLVKGGFPQIFIKPGLSFYYAFFRKGIGEIDNENKIIHLLGYTSNNEYTTSSKYGKTIHHVKSLEVDYTLENAAIVPQISITNSPYKIANHLFRKMYFGATFAWILPMLERGGLTLKQSDGNGRHLVARASSAIYKDSNALVTLDNTKVSKSPYSLSGFYCSANLGIYFTEASPKRKGKNLHLF